MRRAALAFAFLIAAGSVARAQDKPPEKPKTLSADDAVELAIRIADNDDEDDADDALEQLRRLGEDGIWDMLDAAKAYDEEAQDVLGRAVAELGKEALPELIRTMGEEDEDIRETAIFALEVMGDDALEALVKVLKDGTSEDVKARAAVLLGKLEDGLAVAPLIQIVKYGPKEARHLAAAALIDIGGPSIVPLVGALGTNKEAHLVSEQALLKIGASSVAAAASVTLATQDLLVSKVADVRDVAAELVGKFGGEACVPKVIEALCSDDEAIRKSAVDCAAALGAPAVPRLVFGLNAENKKTADAAADALIGIGEPAVPELTKMLKAPMVQVRGEVLYVLVNMKRRASIPDIAPLLEDQDEAVRAYAHRVVEHLTGAKLEKKADALSWWEQHRNDPEK